MRAVAAIDGDSFLLAYDRIEGATLDKTDPAIVDDALLRQIWEQVALLRAHRIAHRDLRRANILLDPDGRPWLIDFGFAEVAASDALLDADVAQLLAALSIQVGVPRTVDSAVAALGTDTVARCLPKLQMGALSGATQSALKQHPGLLKELHASLREATGASSIELEQIHRLSVKQLLIAVMLIGVVYFLAPQFADLPEVWSNVKDASWAWFGPMLIASAVSYVGATLSFMGSIPDRLRFGPTLATQTGSSFVSKLAPAGLGGMALNVRYAQKAGIDPAVAVPSVGLNTVAGIGVHLTMAALFILWAGRSAADFKLPDPTYFVIGIAVVLAMAGVSMAVPALRKLVLTKLIPILRRSVHGVGAVLRNPAKLFLLLGGSAIVTVSYIVCFYFATLAFGADLRFATVGAVYLLGSAVASVAPTPGGLGAMEAALFAGLTAAGMDASVALPAVFLYRLATFWLPILPGWICFSWLKRAEYV
jgi:undecaprenyl-diphosphatase